MFIEDVRVAIMPYYSHQEESRLQITLVPNNEDFEEEIAQALSREQYSDFASSVADLFQDCAVTILSYGKCCYEIVYISDPETKSIVGFDLVPLIPSSLQQKSNHFVQYVPTSIRKERNISQYITLDRESMLIFAPPPTWKYALEPMMKSLASVSNRFLPDFALRQMTEVNSVPYNSKQHIKSEKLALAEVTRTVGWTARNLLSDVMLDPYYLIRQLRFEGFLIAFREEILRILNEGISHIGKMMGVSAKIVIEGLPTQLDIENALQHLNAGDQSLKEVMAPFRLA